MSNPKQQQQQQVEEEKAGKLAIHLANAAVLPMVLKSAIELNIIDIIYSATKGGSDGGSSLSSSQIAARIHAKNPDAPILLDRMLRLLTSYDILKCSFVILDNGQVERFYSANPICKFLTVNNQDQNGSVGPLFLLHHDEILMKSWYHLNDAILGGGIPFNKAHGMSLFEYPETDQRFNRVFNEAMSNHTILMMNMIVDVYKGFEGVNVLVDVGGGVGAALRMITSKYPKIKGINFDLPHVLADAPSYPGVEHVGGDMFVSVPKGDAIFMKRILHDWSDEQCIKLLKNCWEALPDDGKVIIVDSILPEATENDFSSRITLELDMLMFTVCPGGKERSQKEFETLARDSGFSSCEVVLCAYSGSVIEFHKKK